MEAAKEMPTDSILRPNATTSAHNKKSKYIYSFKMDNKIN